MTHKKISELRNWSDNPRSIKPERFQELKNRITRFGQFKPVIITPDGEVLGGNMRLKAMKELGIEDIWVSIVEPKTEAEKIEIALTDNEEMGFYEDKVLIALIQKYQQDINIQAYKVNDGKTKSLADLIKETSKDQDKPEIEFTEELLEEHNYIVLYFDNQIDWLNLQTLYPLKTVQEKDSKPGYQRVGVGRVVRGVDFLEAIQK